MTLKVLILQSLRSFFIIFGRSHDDMIYWKNAYVQYLHPWFDAQLDQKIMNGLYYVFFLHVNRSFLLFFQVTHQVLLSSNVSGQTLLTLIEVNRESLSESLPLVLKREYGCHRRDMRRTELCLSEQLETSASASEIIVVRILNQRVTLWKKLI